MPYGVKTLVQSRGGMIFHPSFGNGLHEHSFKIQGFSGPFTEQVAEGLGRRYLRLMQAWNGRELFWWRRMPCPVEMPSHWREACNNLGQDCTWFLGKQISGCQRLDGLCTIVQSAALVSSRVSQA